MVTLDQFKGRFVYLSFFNSGSSDCRVETDSIVSLEKRLRQILTVISVAVDDDFAHASNLWKTKGYSCELLNGSRQKQLIVNYNASFTPVFYLIGPEGTLLLSQAPSPSHGFEAAFLKLLWDNNFKHKPRQFKPSDLRWSASAQIIRLARPICRFQRPSVVKVLILKISQFNVLIRYWSCIN